MLAMLTVTAQAHHSEAAFDTQTVVAFEGLVRRFAWRNPHVYIQVETQDAEGRSVDWEIETGATPILRRSGWTPDSLAPGDRVRVRGHPERDTGRNYAILISIEKSDGSVLSQNPYDPDRDERATSLSGIWKGNQPSIDAFIERFNRIALTAKGRAAKSAYDFQTDSPVASCTAHAVPRSLVAAGLFLTEIDVQPDRVELRSEYFDVERVVDLDARGHPTEAERTTQGHSIGRWEDDTLIVDATLFADSRSASGFGVPSGAHKRVTERFSVSGDGKQLHVEITLEDPEYLAEPFTGSVKFDYRPWSRAVRIRL